MTADNRNTDPVLEHYLEQAGNALAKAEQTLAVPEREEFLRMAMQWLLLAEEYVKKISRI